MSDLILDKPLADQLTACRGITALRNPEGAVIGVFEPGSLPIYEEGTLPDFDEAELTRRAARRQGIPSDEVRRMLERLR